MVNIFSILYNNNVYFKSLTYKNELFKLEMNAQKNKVFVIVHICRSVNEHLLNCYFSFHFRKVKVKLLNHKGMAFCNV
jgi:hypothetical protein